MPTKTIRRPAAMQDATALIQFAHTLQRALERIGVAPGEDFAIATPEAVRARARRGDPETSRQAARSVRDLTGSQAAVLKVFRDYGHGKGFTDEELLRAYDRGVSAGVVRRQSPSGVRSRRAELAESGFVVDSSRRAKTAANRDAVVWTLAEHVQPTPRLTVVVDNKLFDTDALLVPGA